ncbi:DNA-binding transcriptional regulator, LysR family [Paracoccus halophilus]|nr:LysR family transcriptional regulator [Paracoccus halophilus]SFA61320.1 DNA-binding transcriptional regulator, LysR family [Paracoccus halophilus]
MDRFRQMQLFIAVMETGSFTRAAEALSIPRSTVSTSIQALEDRLQCQLLHRTTRKIVPTSDGIAFLQAARDIVDAVTGAEQMFTGDQVQISGRLRVGMPSRIARKIVIPALPAFLARHPELSVEFSASDQLTDLVAGGMDCVLRVGVPNTPELIARKLQDIPFVTCASPAYLGRYGRPADLRDLSSHVLVNYTPQFPATESVLTFCDNGKPRDIPMQGSVTVDGAEAYLAAALAGLGLIQVPLFDVRDLLETGALIEILPDFAPPPEPLSFLYARRRNLSARVRVFQKWLEGVLREGGV